MDQATCADNLNLPQQQPIKGYNIDKSLENNFRRLAKLTLVNSQRETIIAHSLLTV